MSNMIRLRMDESFLLSLFEQGKRQRYFVKKGLPPDAKIFHVKYKKDAGMREGLLDVYFWTSSEEGHHIAEYSEDDFPVHDMIFIREEKE